MRDMQIIVGLSDIKSELLTKSGSSRTRKELEIYFTFQRELLLVHDKQRPETFMILANYNRRENKWYICLDNKNLGRRVIEFAIQSVGSPDLVHKELNRLDLNLGFKSSLF